MSFLDFNLSYMYELKCLNKFLETQGNDFQYEELHKIYSNMSSAELAVERLLQNQKCGFSGFFPVFE